MKPPAIDFSNIYAIILLFSCTVIFVLTIDRTRVAKFIPGPVFLIFIPFVFSTLGLIPTRAAEYSFIGKTFVPMGIVLLLIDADIPKIIRSSGRLLRYFIIGAAASVFGVAVASIVIDLGAVEAGVGAMLTAYAIGGTLNVVSVGQAVQIEPSTMTAVITASMIVLASYVVIAMVMIRSDFVRRFLRFDGGLQDVPPVNQSTNGENGIEPSSPKTLSRPSEDRDLAKILTSIVLALGLFLITSFLLGLINQQKWTIVAVTFLTLLLANGFKRVKNYIAGARTLGTLLMYVFLCSMAAQVDIEILGALGIKVVAMWAIITPIHLVILMAVGRFFRIDPSLLFLASLAGLGGPPACAAVAAATNRPELVTPSVLCAMLGVVLGTFAGVAWYGIAQ